MKKLLIILLTLISLNSFSQTVFNAAFEHRLTPKGAGKRDTTIIDTIYLSVKKVTFTITKFSANVYAVDSITNINSLNYNSITEIGNGKANQNYRLSNHLSNDNNLDVQSYVLNPYETNVSYTLYNVTYLLLKTRLTNNSTTVPTTPVFYIHYNINANYF